MVAMNALVLICVLAVAYGQNIQVTTKEGTIEGYPATDGNYYTFHGIPYALPRTGLDQFTPSSSPGALPGLFHAYDSAITCARPGPNGNIGLLNCLVLNVFTNDVTTSKPVLVWLNGEEFNSSTTQYSFKRYIEEEEIVVVTLNYRLSVFGNLCLDIPRAPGNAGLKDIILGLQWIHGNIAAFGGNPNNVVLMGHGSAAVMVDLVTLTPKSENLVHKAIALSGSAMAPGAVSYDPISPSILLIQFLGYNVHSLDDIPLMLSQSITLDEISNVFNRFNYTNNTQVFAPCIEDATSEDAVLTDSPINLLRAGNYNHIPYISGYVTREGTQRVQQAVLDGWLEKMQTEFKDFLPADLKLDENETAITQDIRDFYFQSGAINMTSIDNYFHYHGDMMVVVPAIRGVRERAATSQSEVRLLEFGYMGTNNSDWDFDQISLSGVRHGGILNYIFEFDLKEEDKNVSDSIVKRISSFMHTGTPSLAGSPDWPVVTNQSFAYLHHGGSSEDLNHQETNMVNPQANVMSFWDPLYAEYYFPPRSSAGRLMGLISVILFSLIAVILF